jgi:hypothetical protein
VKEATIFS